MLLHDFQGAKGSGHRGQATTVVTVKWDTKMRIFAIFCKPHQRPRNGTSRGLEVPGGADTGHVVENHDLARAATVREANDWRDRSSAGQVLFHLYLSS